MIFGALLALVLISCICFSGTKKASAAYVSSIKQTAAGKDSVTVTWDAYAGAASYRYQLEGGSAPLSGDVYENVATVAGLQAGSLYTIQISACSAAGEEIAQSLKIEVKTLPGKVEKKNFGVSSAYTNINVYYFLVNVNTTQSGYEWQFANTAGKVKKTQTTSGFSSLHLQNFINGTFYKYRVRPYMTFDGKNTYAAWSAWKYIGVVKKGNYKATKSSIQITWDKLKGAKKYIVYASKKESSGYQKIKTVSASKRKATLKKLKGKALKKGTKYYFKIIPVAKIGKKFVKADSYIVYNAYTRSF